MLKPRAARIPETRESTPGSFCTRQLSIWRFGGAVEGRGVSYRMLLTAAAGETVEGFGATGSGEMRRCKAL